MKFEQININTYKGGIPSGKDLVIAEKGNEEATALILYGFDEVGDMDDSFKNPVYGFM
jgi:hypothetical protein